MDDVRESLTGQAGLLCELLTSAMQPHLQKADMTLSTFELLSAVHALRGKGTQADIARRLGITPPSLSESVKIAIKRGFVEQFSNPKDGRAKYLRITTTGTRALNSVVKAVRDAEEGMLKGLSPSETAIAIRVLQKANKNLASALQEP